MSDYREDTLLPHARMHLLLSLAAAQRYTAHSYLLSDRLDDVGMSLGGAALAAQLQWLRDSGAVLLERLEGGWLATLTAPGLDIAEGRATLDGVERPRPGQRP